jgi:hypothetical protein
MMSTASALTLWLAANAALPALAPISEGGMHLAAPEGWRSWFNVDEHNATCALGLATSVRIYWYPFKERLPIDRVLDIVLKVTRENVPFGEVVELERVAVLDGASRGLKAEYRAFGYQMSLGMVAINDALHDRMVAAVMLADPATFDDLGGVHLAAAIAASVRSDGDAAAELIALNPPERRLYAEPVGSLLP